MQSQITDIEEVVKDKLQAAIETKMAGLQSLFKIRDANNFEPEIQGVQNAGNNILDHIQKPRL